MHRGKLARLAVSCGGTWPALCSDRGGMAREHRRPQSCLDLTADEAPDALPARAHLPRLHIRYRARYHPRIRPYRANSGPHDERNILSLLQKLRCLDEDLLDLERKAARRGGFERLGQRLVRGFERRAALASRLPFGLDGLYRVLATRCLLPIGTVFSHRCTGCGHKLPPKTERAGHRLGGLLMCPHCGRILVTEAAPGRTP